MIREIAAGGGSTAFVSALLNPIDVVKTRRQLYPKHKTPLTIARDLYVQEGGLKGLWLPGLRATVVREIFYSGCTKGLYPHVRSFFASGDEDPTLFQRACAAAATGTLGSFFANAVDVVKIRQFDNPSKYPTLFGAFADIVTKEGLVGGLLIRGVSASAPRGAAIAMGEVTTYDYTKHKLKANVEYFQSRGDDEPFVLHAITSMITGVVATTVASPFDVLKTRVMASESGGFFDAFADLFKAEGTRGFFRGWWPNYWRLGPHAMLTFPLLEFSRSALGLGYF
eukprot:g3570.t1